MVIARQSTARTVMVGPVLDADGVAVTDAVVGDFTISKNGGAPGALNGSATLTHRQTGHYSLALTTADLDTVGQAEIVINDGVNACPVKVLTVVEEAVYDALFAAAALGYVANAPVNVAQFGGTNGTFASGRPEVNTTHWGGTAVASANVLIDGAITAAKIASDALTAAKIQDGALTAAKFAAGAFDAVWSVATRILTAGTNIVLAKGTGVTGFNDLDAAGVRSAVGLASANLDAQLAAILADTGEIGAAGAGLTEAGGTGDQFTAVLARLVALTVATGSVQDNVANTATAFETDLAETADHHWRDAFVLITSGALAGQVKRITAYDGTTKVLTVAGGFTAAPATAVTFAIINR